MMYPNNIREEQTFQDMLSDREIVKENETLFMGDLPSMKRGTSLSPFVNFEFQKEEMLAMSYGTAPSFAWIYDKSLRALELNITQAGVTNNNRDDIIKMLGALGYMVKQLGDSSFSTKGE